jgi:hypothetical protein
MGGMAMRESTFRWIVSLIILAVIVGGLIDVARISMQKPSERPFPPDGPMQILVG